MNIQESLDQTEGTDNQFFHWADFVAERIIQTRKNQDSSSKNSFTCASGITPSGTVHIGNFREIMSVDLVVRALRARGKTVRFIYSWDDYDVFRKVPKNMPQQDMLKSHLRWPIVMVPDPWGKEESYARHHEVAVENILPAVGIFPEFLYQAKKYMNSEYADKIRHALLHKARIKTLLDEFRTEELDNEWWPISVFANKSHKDCTTVCGWDGEWAISYRDDSTSETETVDLRTTGAVKLPWRIDWPMRWSVEGVDFEPAGKDHHSDGGSWSTAEKICTEIFGIQAPVTFKYDFVRTKGRDGKMSSSSGEVIDLYDVLEVYTPELARFLFAGTRPNTEFAISFDLDVIKIYEDYDRTERIYYGHEKIDASHEASAVKMTAKEKRIYELSQTKMEPDGVLPFMPLQIPFRTLCNLLLIHLGNIDNAIEAFPGTKEARSRGELDNSSVAGAENLRRIKTRARCAWEWVQKFAPADMKFTPNTIDSPLLSLSEQELETIRGLATIVSELETFSDDTALQDRIFALTKQTGINQKSFFTIVYRILISKDQGPRLASFIRILGKEAVLNLLSRY